MSQMADDLPVMTRMPTVPSSAILLKNSATVAVVMADEKVDCSDRSTIDDHQIGKG